MLRSISASDVANEISMSRSRFKGTYLVVEGETDLRLYTKFIEKDGVRIMVAHSKDNVRKTISLCIRRMDEKVVGIVDRDLDSLLNVKAIPPVFHTDRRDMESTLMCTSAMDSVIAEYGDRDRVDEFESKNGDIRGCIGLASAYLGALMFVSYRKGMNLIFKEPDHSQFVDPRTLKVDVQRMVKYLYSRSMAQRYPVSEIVSELESYINNMEDPWDIARGHDSVSLFVIGLRNAFGSYNASRLNDNQLGGALRMAFSEEEFRNTELFRKSDKWVRGKGLVLWRTA